MYSAYVRLLNSAYEEMAESITEEDRKYLYEKYKGMTLQKLLYDSAGSEVLDYILHTKKQRETLKKYDPATKQAELKFFACLRLDASLNMFQALSEEVPLSASENAILESAILIQHKAMHPELSQPLDHMINRMREASDCLDKINRTFSSKPPKV